MDEIELGSVRVAEMMNREPSVVEETVVLRDVTQVLRSQSHVWVVKSQESREVVGIVTERDFLDPLSRLPDMTYATGVPRTKSLYHGDWPQLRIS